MANSSLDDIRSIVKKEADAYRGMSVQVRPSFETYIDSISDHLFRRIFRNASNVFTQKVLKILSSIENLLKEVLLVRRDSDIQLTLKHPGQQPMIQSAARMFDRLFKRDRELYEQATTTVRLQSEQVEE